MKLRWLVLFCAFVLSVPAQEPVSFTPIWQSVFDTAGFDAASSAKLDAAGNFIVVGQTFGADSGSDGLVMKVNPTGQRVWARRFDSAISGDDYFTQSAVDANGNVAVVGLAAERDSLNAFVIASFHASTGTQRWARIIPGQHVTSGSVAVDSAGNVLATVGVENGPGQIIRTYKLRNSDGAGVWTNNVQAARDLRFGFNSEIPMLVGPDDSCYIASLTNNTAAGRGDLDWMVVKLFSNGASAGYFTAGNPKYDSQPFMTFHTSGDLLLAGTSENASGGFDILIQRIRIADGTRLWQTKLSGASTFKAGSHIPVDLRSDSSGRVLLAGNSPGWGGFVSRFTANGFFEWTTHFQQSAVAIVPFPNGQSFVTLDNGVGWIDTNGCVLKYESGRYKSVPVASADNGSVYVAGSFYSSDGFGDIGLEAEKLTISRDASAPRFTKLETLSGGYPGDSVTLAPEVSGTGLTFAWSHNGSPILGATNRTYFIPSLNKDSIGYYSLEVRNAFGATLCPDIEVLTLRPIFTRQPKDQQFVWDGDIAFSALAVGFEPQDADTGIFASYLSYQWQRWNYDLQRWDDIPGETESKLLFRNARYSPLGRIDLSGDWYYYEYRCVATLFSLFGTEESFSDIVTITDPKEYVEEDSTKRGAYVLTGEAYSQPAGMTLRDEGGVHVAMQSGKVLYRVALDGGIVNYTGENFRPASRALPGSPQLFDPSMLTYYSIGETNRPDTSVDWIVSKRTAAGALLWTQTIGSLGKTPDAVADAVIDPQGNLIISGYGNTDTTGRDFLTVSLKKEDGSLRWSASYHDPEGIRLRYVGENVTQIAVDPMGNCYVAGTGFDAYSSFYLLVSYSPTGVQRYVYKRPFDYENGTDQPPLLAVDSDGTAVMAGSFGILKVDATGRELWVTDTRPDNLSDPSICLGLRLDKAGNIYMTEDTSLGYFLEKYDAFGEWQKWTTADDVFPERIFKPGARFQVDDFGNVFLPGFGGNTSSEKDIFLLKLDSNLERLWSVRVDGDAHSFDQAFDVRVRGHDVFLTGTVDYENTTEVSLTQFWQDGNPVAITHLNHSQTVRKGTAFSASVTTQGSPTIFRWYRNGNLISGQTASTLSIPSIDYSHEGFYHLEAENSAGAIGISGGFALRVAEGPQITEHPQSTNVVVKGDIRLSGRASGTFPVTWQWLRDNQPIPGATNRSLLIAGAEFQDRGQYQLVASNEWGTATSNPATVNVVAPANLPPLIALTEPIEGAVRKDLSAVTLRAKVYDPDGRVIRVAFKVNGGLITNVTADPFEARWIPAAPGIYKVSAEATDNLLATGRSQEVNVIVASDPVIVQEPGATKLIAENADLVLVADATGTPPPRYQWRLNGANIPGATNRIYSVGGVQVRHSGNYAVIAVNEGSAKISNPTEVIVETSALVMKDKLVDAVTRNDFQFTGRTSNVGASNEPSEVHAGRKGGSSVWLKWKAPASGVVTLNTRGSAIDTLLGVYTNVDSVTLTNIASDDERGGFHCSLARFNAIKDQVYSIAVDGYKGKTGNIVLSWALDSSARELPRLQIEPVPFSAVFGAAKQFAPQVSGTNLKFQWYLNGYPIPGATAALIQFSSLSKANLGNYVLRISNDGGSIETIAVSLEAVSTNSLVTQDRAEDLRFVSSISGDRAFAGGYPTISPGIPYQHFFNTQGSTTDNDEPILGDGGGASKWFMVTAGAAGTLVADTAGSQFNTLLTLHDGSNFDTLPVLANGLAQPDGSSRVQYPATAGKSYVMRVDGPEGNVVLNVNIGSAPIMAATPLDKVVAAGTNLVLTASVSGAVPAPTFQWYLNGVPLTGQTANNLSINNFNVAQVGMYELEARNPLASVRKTIAYLELRRDTVFSPLTKVAGGGTQLRLEGNNLTYSIEATADFKSWTNVFSGRAENGALIYTENPIPGNPYRFYRARIQ